MRIVSIGEILWDVIGGHEYLGGAPFNFAAHAVRLGHQVKFVSAVGRDRRGDLARQQAETLGIETDLLLETTQAETGISCVSLNESGQATHALPRPAAYDFVSITERQLASIQQWQPEWIYFGTLLQMTASARQLTCRLCEESPGAKRFYDVNLRPGQFTSDIVRQMLGLATIVKVNDEEVSPIAAMTGVEAGTDLERFSHQLGNQYAAEAICITEGKNGCSVLERKTSAFLHLPGYQVKVADTVGSGDAFSAAFVHGWSEGWALERICDFANRVGAIVASRPGAIPAWTAAEALALR